MAIQPTPGSIQTPSSTETVKKPAIPAQAGISPALIDTSASPNSDFVPDFSALGSKQTSENPPQKTPEEVLQQNRQYMPHDPKLDPLVLAVMPKIQFTAPNFELPENYKTQYFPGMSDEEINTTYKLIIASNMINLSNGDLHILSPLISKTYQITEGDSGINGNNNKVFIGHLAIVDHRRPWDEWNNTISHEMVHLIDITDKEEDGILPGFPKDAKEKITTEFDNFKKSIKQKAFESLGQPEQLKITNAGYTKDNLPDSIIYPISSVQDIDGISYNVYKKTDGFSHYGITGWREFMATIAEYYVEGPESRKIIHRNFPETYRILDEYHHRTSWPETINKGISRLAKGVF